MSELLYLYDKIDWRFCPLVTAVRQWAAWAKLTSVTPGNQITNFTLTLMVVFFLQRCSPPILPTLGEMTKMARPQVDTRQAEDINCSFLRDPFVFQLRSKSNSESPEDLFMGFLRFVGSFDFSEQSISIITGDSHRKFDSKPLYVQNPLERELNVSRNVTLTELTRLVMEARNALYILETQEDQNTGKNWGLLALPRAKSLRQIKQEMSHSNQVKLNIKDLFCDDYEEEIDDFTETRLSETIPLSPQTNSSLKQFTEEVHPVSSHSNAANEITSEVQNKKELKGTTESKNIESNLKVLLSDKSSENVNSFAAEIVSKKTEIPFVSRSNALNEFVDQVQHKAGPKVIKTQKKMPLNSNRNRWHVEKQKIK